LICVKEGGRQGRDISSIEGREASPPHELEECISCVLRRFVIPCERTAVFQSLSNPSRFRAHL